MGSSNSTELLAVRLHAQAEAVTAIDAGQCHRAPMALQALRVSHYATDITLTLRATKTTSPLCRITTAGRAKGSKREVFLGGHDQCPRLHLWFQQRTSSWLVVDAEADRRLFEIVLRAETVCVRFDDAVTGEPTRVLVNEPHDDRVALVRLVRRTKQQVAGEGPVAVARIRRPESRGKYEHDFALEVAPGVDLLLVVLVWYVRWEAFEDSRDRQ